MPFTLPDLLALAWFVVAWIGYAVLLEYVRTAATGLNARMNRYREVWMRRMLDREMRMVDMQIMAALQNGTAFFASTSLFAIGGALTIIRSTDDVLNVVATLPIGIQTGRVLWEMKAIGLAVIFVYAFFKFGWSYRLYNYVAILLGAMPPPAEKDTEEAQAHVRRTARLFTAARAALQSRPARVLLRARLSRLVRQPLCVHGNDRRGRVRDVVAAVRLGRQQGRRR